jgi:hypothetical protein
MEMNLFELLFVALICALVGLLGRALFGIHVWLAGALPLVLLFVILPILGKIRRLRTDPREPVEQNPKRQRNTSERHNDD